MEPRSGGGGVVVFFLLFFCFLEGGRVDGKRKNGKGKKGKKRFIELIILSPSFCHPSQRRPHMYDITYMKSPDLELNLQTGFLFGAAAAAAQTHRRVPYLTKKKNKF